MHDWPDRQCLSILQNIVSAMGSDSEIWIDEIVVPNQGAAQAQVNYDWTMVAAVAGIERSKDQWSALLDDAGLLIREIHPVNTARGEAVIVAVRK